MPEPRTAPSRPSSRDPRIPRWPAPLLWPLLASGLTLAMLAARGRIGTAHVTLLYLLVVLGASAHQGRRVGLLLSVLCFLAFNVLFVEPYGTLRVHDPLDWLVLIAFLATSAVAAQLLHRAQAEAAAAERRAAELQRIADIGAGALESARAEDAAALITDAVHSEAGAAETTLYLRTADGDQFERIASAPRGAHSLALPAEIVPATALVLGATANARLVPLHIRDRQVGVLVFRADTAIPVAVERQPVIEALAHFAALGLERIRLTRDLELAERARMIDGLKDAMLSAVSHDLRTPLTTIKALAREISASGDRRAVVVEAEADRLNRYVTNLLDLSRLNAGTLPLSLEPVPLDDLVGALLQDLTGVIGDRDVRITLDGDVRRLVASCDLVLALRILVNVTENALRYSPEDSPLDLRAWRDGDRVRLSVSDRGPGIPAADVARIFLPFERGPAGSAGTGTGLGLAIARRFAEAQHGTLAHAPREGGGAVFTLELPATAVDLPLASSL